MTGADTLGDPAPLPSARQVAGELPPRAAMLELARRRRAAERRVREHLRKAGISPSEVPALRRNGGG